MPPEESQVENLKAIDGLGKRLEIASKSPGRISKLLNPWTIWEMDLRLPPGVLGKSQISNLNSLDDLWKRFEITTKSLGIISNFKSLDDLGEGP